MDKRKSPRRLNAPKLATPFRRPANWLGTRMCQKQVAIIFGIFPFRLGASGPPALKREQLAGARPLMDSGRSALARGRAGKAPI